MTSPTLVAATDTLLLPSWSTTDDYSTVTIGPYELGRKNGLICHVGEVMTDLVVDHKKGSGEDGGGKTLRGLELRKVTIEVEAWDFVGEQLWDQLVPILLPTKNSTGRVVWKVDHPSFRRHSFTQAIVKGIGEKPPDSKGVLTGRILLWEERQKNAPSTTPKKAPPVTATQIQPTIVAAPQLPGVVPPSQSLRP